MANGTESRPNKSSAAEASNVSSQLPLSMRNRSPHKHLNVGEELTSSEKSSRGSSRTPRPKLLFGTSSLPIDLPLSLVRDFHKRVVEVGDAWFEPDTIDISICAIPRESISSEGAQLKSQLKSQHFRNAADIEDFLKKLNTDSECVLLIIHSADKKFGKSKEAKPCITVALFVFILTRLDISPMFIPKVSGNIGFWHQYAQSDIGKGKSRETGKASDFCYNISMPWMQDKTAMSLFSNDHFSVSNYTKIDQDGLPFVTVFSNVPEKLTGTIKEEWQRSLLMSSQLKACALLDHYAIISHGLHSLEDHQKFSEMINALYGENRLETHMASPQGNLETTVARSREYLNQMASYTSALEAIQHLLEGLDIHKPEKRQLNSSEKESPDVNVLTAQLALWNENLQVLASMMKIRCGRLVKRMQETQSLVLSIIALRNSQALAHNTEEMTQMARATEQSGREMKTMTRRMEDDAHLTKFLSEVTAIFLPMTTMAIFFTMGFFEISPDSTGIVPILDKVRFIWIYFVVTIPITLVVYAWWSYKRRAILSHPPAGSNSDSANAENASTPSTPNTTLNEHLAKLESERKYIEASEALRALIKTPNDPPRVVGIEKVESEEEDKISPEDEAGDAINWDELVAQKRKRDAEQSAKLIEVLLAQRAAEIGGKYKS